MGSFSRSRLYKGRACLAHTAFTLFTIHVACTREKFRRPSKICKGSGAFGFNWRFASDLGGISEEET